MKEELFAAFYEYIDSTADLSTVMSTLVNTMISMSFNEEDSKEDRDRFIQEKATTVTLLLYEALIIFA